MAPHGLCNCGKGPFTAEMDVLFDHYSKHSMEQNTKKKKMNINIRIYRQRSLKTQTLPHTSRVEAMIARGLFGMNLYMFF